MQETISLKSLSLIQFRNYLSGHFNFTERIIGISGKNGSGKTNLLDAIYYLCFTKSSFNRPDQQSVKNDYTGFRIEGGFEKTSQEMKKIVCILRENNRKEFSVNDEAYQRFSEHIGKFPCIMIAPDDIALISGGSEERRKFIDSLISQL